MDFIKSVIRSLPQVFWNLGLIGLGSALCAVAINGILIPRQFLSGGFTGLALILHYLSPSLPLGGIYFLLNLPNYAFGWKYVGKRFFIYSVAGMLIFSAAIQGIHVTLPVYDQLLSALLAGIIVGIGSGIILKSLGSAGGTDILSVILLKLFSVRLGTTILAFNSIILGAAALLLPLEKALYTMIYLYITSYMVNLMVTGLSQRKAVFVISPQWQGISQRIMEDIQRGVTIIEGQGAFSGQEQHILYTVITFRELSRLKTLVRAMDPNAFVVVSDTLEVMGRRVGNQPHW
ncbi:MAG: YitT family protein [Desulfobacterales bacterium]|nr:YitT family protein [Desulfobacterales bacterium]